MGRLKICGNIVSMSAELDKEAEEEKEKEKSSVLMFTMSATGAVVGATVSALVYTALSTSGEVAATATGAGIELAGAAIGYGADLTMGSAAGSTVRALANGYSAVVRPAISSTSKLGAAGISVLAGAGAALTTNALVYGGKKVGSYLYSRVEDYKYRVATKVQHETPLDEFSDAEIIMFDEKGRAIYLLPTGEELCSGETDIVKTYETGKRKTVRWKDSGSPITL
jgi:hypothetical protein